MGKEITLPWSCETQDKILIGLGWLVLITSPLCLIATFWCAYIGLVTTPLVYGFLLLVTVYGFLGTVISWFIKVLNWSYDDKLPHFSCKRQIRKGVD